MSPSSSGTHGLLKPRQPGMLPRAVRVAASTLRSTVASASSAAAPAAGQESACQAHTLETTWKHDSSWVFSSFCGSAHLPALANHAQCVVPTLHPVPALHSSGSQARSKASNFRPTASP